MVDAAEGLLGMEWIDGQSVKWLLPSGADDGDEQSVDDVEQSLESFDISIGNIIMIYLVLIDLSIYQPH